MSKKDLDPTKRMIKKYQNRKLYDTQDSKYVTLDDIANMIKKGEEVIVLDNQTKKDVTAIILTQILYDQEKFKKSILPLTLLKNIIQSGSGTLYEFMQKFVISGLNTVNNSKVEAERYVERLIEKGDISRGEGKTILKELLTTSEKSFGELEKRIEEKISNVIRKEGKLNKIEDKISSLNGKIDQLERKITEIIT